MNNLSNNFINRIKKTVKNDERENHSNPVSAPRFNNNILQEPILVRATNKGIYEPDFKAWVQEWERVRVGIFTDLIVNDEIIGDWVPAKTGSALVCMHLMPITTDLIIPAVPRYDLLTGAFFMFGYCSSPIMRFKAEINSGGSYGDENTTMNKTYTIKDYNDVVFETEALPTQPRFPLTQYKVQPASIDVIGWYVEDNLNVIIPEIPEIEACEDEEEE